VRAYLDPDAIVATAVRAGADAVYGRRWPTARGIRRVAEPKDLRDAVETCMREAEGAFGDPTVFVEQAVAR
jgi:pyruvate carboxylase